jgi:hypothetical protein
VASANTLRSLAHVLCGESTHDNCFAPWLAVPHIHQADWVGFELAVRLAKFGFEIPAEFPAPPSKLVFREIFPPRCRLRGFTLVSKVRLFSLLRGSKIRFQERGGRSQKSIRVLFWHEVSAIDFCTRALLGPSPP